MCGIIGLYGPDQVINDLIFGMTALQHRGQDAAGIITFNKTFHIKKGLGLVSNVFSKKHIKRLKGNMGLGHVRYTTHGSTESVNAQPFSANYPFGLAMAHNGNVTNFKSLTKTLYNDYHILPETNNDLELILYTFASELQKKDLGLITPEDILESVEATQRKVLGAYSVITLIANHGLLAFTDSRGIRPLVMGKRITQRGKIFGFASESSCFDFLGYDTIGDVKAGEAVFIDDNMKVHRRVCHQQKKSFCIFEHIYFAREDSIVKERLVARERVKLGRLLATNIRKAGLQPDIVIDVPTSGYFAASGLAEALEIPYRRGFVKNSFVGRSFIAPTQDERETLVKTKLNVIKDVVSGKKVAVVDDSIVRGTTSRRIVKLLKNAGAEKVYFVSAAPPIKHPCIYGIDMAVSTELIASGGMTSDDIARYIDADAVIYQSLDDMLEMYKDFPICHACFSGKYPVENSEKLLEDVAKERMSLER